MESPKNPLNKTKTNKHSFSITVGSIMESDNKREFDESVIPNRRSKIHINQRSLKTKNKRRGQRGKVRDLCFWAAHGLPLRASVYALWLVLS